MKTKHTSVLFISFLAFFLITALSAFTTTKATDDYHYRFGFNHDDGHYTGIIDCEHNISGPNGHHFDVYGPYSSKHSAEDKRSHIIHDWEDEHHGDAHYASDFHCD